MDTNTIVTTQNFDITGGTYFDKPLDVINMLKSLNLDYIPLNVMIQNGELEITVQQLKDALDSIHDIISAVTIDGQFATVTIAQKNLNPYSFISGAFEVEPEDNKHIQKDWPSDILDFAETHCVDLPTWEPNKIDDNFDKLRTKLERKLMLVTWNYVHCESELVWFIAYFRITKQNIKQIISNSGFTNQDIIELIQ
jgi:hypothetical protein